MRLQLQRIGHCWLRGSKAKDHGATIQVGLLHDHIWSGLDSHLIMVQLSSPGRFCCMTIFGQHTQGCTRFAASFHPFPVWSPHAQIWSRLTIDNEFEWQCCKSWTYQDLLTTTVQFPKKLTEKGAPVYCCTQAPGRERVQGVLTDTHPGKQTVTHNLLHCLHPEHLFHLAIRGWASLWLYKGRSCFKSSSPRPI